MSDPIKTGTKSDGSTYYWFRVEAGRNPVTGKRVQVYHSGDRKKDVKAEYARIQNAISERRYVARDGMTVNTFLDDFEPVHGRDLEDGSRAQLHHALARVRERLGDR